MKIVVARADGGFYFKPDNTLNHNNSDYYCPDGVTCLEVVPCIYTHINKAGKCVAGRFAGRYFDAFAFGCLLSDRSANADENISATTDFTSVMDMSWRPLESLPEGGFEIFVNGLRRFSMEKGIGSGVFADAICSVTSRCSLRIGDIVAIELGSAGEIAAGDTVLMESPGKRVEIKIF